VTGDASVPRSALDAAALMLTAMLRHRPDVVATLQAHGTITAVVSRTQATCDLPYFAPFRGSSVCASYVAGAGGTMQLPVTACDEKNLLQEPDDPYGRGTQPYSENICVHELAHTIMNVGLTPADRDQIQVRYDAARGAGLWRNDYAMTNAMEFFAVLSQCYFWAAPPVVTSVHPYGVNGPDALTGYDPASFALLDGIYQGSSDLR
jgi:alpha-glucosidase